MVINQSRCFAGRQFEATIFTRFHKLGFIPNKDLRDLVLTSMTFGTFLVACLGLFLFAATPRRKR